MPWWRKPYTLMLVPHDGSDTQSVTIRGLTVFVLSVSLSLFIGFSTFMALSGFHDAEGSVLSEDLERRVAKLRDQNRRLKKLNQQVTTLQDKLDQSRELHDSILELSGLGDISESQKQKLVKHSVEPGDKTQEKLRKTQQQVRSQVEHNEQLKAVKNFVKKRNRVFEHTPVLWPVDGWLSSNYGVRKDPMGGKGRSFHEGVDLAAWHRSPIRAPADGTVVLSGTKGGYGKTVKIRHEYGYTTLYGHLDERLVEEGDPITKGQLVGRVGSTGHSTGSHLHYEVRVNGEAVNPWPYLVQEYESYESVIDQEALRDAGH